MTQERILIWEINLSEFQIKEIPPLPQFEREAQFEELLARNISLLQESEDSPLTLIAREKSGMSYPDLLCIDDEGNIIVIEIKRGETPREAIGQAIDYAAQIANMEYEELVNYINTGKNNLPDELQYEDFEKFCKEKFKNPEDEVNQSQKILLVGLGLEEGAETMVSWLSECGVDINAIEFQLHKLDDKILLLRKVVLSSEYKETLKKFSEVKKRSKTPDLSVRLSRAVQKGLIKPRTILVYSDEYLSYSGPKALEIKKNNPELFKAEITDIPNRRKIVKWQYDGEYYSLAGLAWELKEYIKKEYGVEIPHTHYVWIEEKTKKPINELINQVEG